jgi:ElaB/YqjD/DUF883 family membrane-anchored ribosome-binding protein
MNTDRVTFPSADDNGLASAGSSSQSLDTPSQAPGKLLNRLVDGAHQTIDRLAERAAPRVEKLEQGVHGANDVLHDRALRVRDAGDEWIESMRTSVREHPVVAVGIALAAGMLLARMTQR